MERQNKIEEIQKCYEGILDVVRPGWRENQHLIQTPRRAAKAMLEMNDGYDYPDERINTTFEAEESKDTIVCVEAIKYHTNCAHHLLPFFGEVGIAYLPDNKLIGLSKFARIVRKYSRRLQIQEEMVSQIADEIQKILQPKGVFVYAKGIHMCMQMRGIESQGSTTKTTALRGLFLDDPAAKQEAMSLMNL